MAMLPKSCLSTQLTGKRKATSIPQLQQHINTPGSMMPTAVSVAGMSVPRIQRKVVRFAGKRNVSGKRLALPVEAFNPCDSSSDSGLGLEQYHERLSFPEPAKHKRMTLRLESEDANDNFAFQEAMDRAKKTPFKPQLQSSSTPRRRPRPSLPPVQAVNQLLIGQPRQPPVLQILSQPEQQHRARYQTEGSRGAIKDRSGTGFPTIKLVGYVGPATLQVLIGCDSGRVAPHMFYQACRVSGKNSTPCLEKIISGTSVIEIDFDPTKDMVVTCDCVGILKQRNVDVEHRFPNQSVCRPSKKKSTRCRLVFRVVIPTAGGQSRILEAASQPIVCTQPPGVPEICKKSLDSAPCCGGQELFILGKNFLKDTRVTFSSQESPPLWQVAVVPDKEYLQQSHLVCVVPAYSLVSLSSPVTVSLAVTSGGKTSDTHVFRYTPLPSQQVGHQRDVKGFGNTLLPVSRQSTADSVRVLSTSAGSRPTKMQYLLVQATQGTGKESVFLWKPPPVAELPPLSVFSPALPSTTQQSASRTRGVNLPSPHAVNTTASEAARVCQNLAPNSTSQSYSPRAVNATASEAARVCQKLAPNSTSQSYSPRAVNATASETALVCQNLSPNSTSQSYSQDQNSMSATEEDIPCSTKHLNSPPIMPMTTGADLSGTQSPSVDTLRRFVSSKHSSCPLPTLSVEKFLSGLKTEVKPSTCFTSPLTLEKLLFGVPDVPIVGEAVPVQYCDDDVKPTIERSESQEQKEISIYKTSHEILTTSLPGGKLYSKQQDLATHENISGIFESEAEITIPATGESINHSASPSHVLIINKELTLDNCQSAFSTAMVDAEMILTHPSPTQSSVVQSETSSDIAATQSARLEALVSSALSPPIKRPSAAEHLLMAPPMTTSLDACTTATNILLPHQLLTSTYVDKDLILQHIAVEVPIDSVYANKEDLQHIAVEVPIDSMYSVKEDLQHIAVEVPIDSMYANKEDLQHIAVEVPIGSMYANKEDLQHIAVEVPINSMYADKEACSARSNSMNMNAQLITPETVRLDAFVNSAMDNHANSCLESRLMLQRNTDLNVAQSDVPFSVGATDTNVMLHLDTDLNRIQSDVPYSVQPSVGATNTLQLNTDLNRIQSDVPYSVQPSVGATNTLQLNTDLNRTQSDVPYSIQPSVGATNTLQLNTDLNRAQSDVPYSIQPSVGANNTLQLHTDLNRTQSDMIQQKREEGMVSHELTRMSDSDLISYINPSCFDSV